MSQGVVPALGRVLLNLAGIAGAVAAVVLGLSALAPQAEPDTDAQQDRPGLATPVGIMTLALEDEIFVQRQFLGRLEARQSADIGFEISGTVDEILVSEGGEVRAGDLLARLKTDALLAERQTVLASLATVRSQFDFAVSEVERLERLVQRGAAPRNQLEAVQAERDTFAARLAEVESAVEQADLRLEKSRLIAPFDGIAGARDAARGETVAAGQTIVSVFDSSGVNFRVGLPTTLDPEALQNPRIRLNGEEYAVRLRSVRPDIDLRTNTRIAIFEVLTDDVISFGLSATLIGDVALPLRGAWVPMDAMRPSAEGYWIVLAVGDDMVAQRVAVEVLHQRGDEVFVRGAFDTGTRIISAGAHKVVPGQPVREP